MGERCRSRNALSNSSIDVSGLLPDSAWQKRVDFCILCEKVRGRLNDGTRVSFCFARCFAVSLFWSAVVVFRLAPLRDRVTEDTFLMDLVVRFILFGLPIGGWQKRELCMRSAKLEDFLAVLAAVPTTVVIEPALLNLLGLPIGGRQKRLARMRSAKLCDFPSRFLLVVQSCCVAEGAVGAAVLNCSSMTFRSGWRLSEFS